MTTLQWRKWTSLWLNVGAARMLDMLLPPHCPLCRAPVAEAHALCGDCWAGLPLLDGPACPVSGLPLAGSPQAIAAYLSLPALTEQVPWQTLIAACFHDGSARRLVHRLKYHDDHAPARLMARLLLKRLQATLPRRELANALIVPVPLHRRRLWQRRFNQSALLAQGLASHLRIPCLPDALLRTRPTRPQTGLSGIERRRNLRDAFAANPRHAARLQGRTVLLLDDVFTTGATARACAHTLRQAGVSTVHVAVFALASQRRALHI